MRYYLRTVHTTAIIYLWSAFCLLKSTQNLALHPKEHRELETCTAKEGKAQGRAPMKRSHFYFLYYFPIKTWAGMTSCPLHVMFGNRVLTKQEGYWKGIFLKRPFSGWQASTRPWLGNQRWIGAQLGNHTAPLVVIAKRRGRERGNSEFLLQLEREDKCLTSFSKVHGNDRLQQMFVKGLVRDLAKLQTAALYENSVSCHQGGLHGTGTFPLLRGSYLPNLASLGESGGRRTTGSRGCWAPRTARTAEPPGSWGCGGCGTRETGRKQWKPKSTGLLVLKLSPVAADVCAHRTCLPDHLSCSSELLYN